eukprot:gb/GEZN01005950.1/.p1 GENE.gb/GEZN01005950.1/~~gb/GEZN01005950.1/.p1  ORF type:complete len:540 (-),score=53.43 gb/GEZN01005950.1/:58-1677(-)
MLSPRLMSNAIKTMTRAKPLVMCVTNRVTPQRVADLMLASGASPAMIDNPDEVPAFASISSAVYVNAGLHSSQISALQALQTMQKRPPMVVDPVGFGASPYRDANIIAFLDAITHKSQNKQSLVIKGNANEICGLAGVKGEGQGVDSAAATAGSIGPALVLSRRYGCVVSVTGDHDIIVDTREGQDRVCRVVGDSPLMSKVTGTGCALGGIVAAALATASPKNACGEFVSVVAAHAMYTLAARMAILATKGQGGPGSLSFALPDALYSIANTPTLLHNHDCLVERLRGENITSADVMTGGDSQPQEQRQLSKIRQNADWRVYVLTDDAWHNEDLLSKLEAAIQGGATSVQLRLKHASTHQWMKTAEKVKELCLRYGVTFIICDRVDIALAVNADGVHVGAEDLCPIHARRLIGPHKILGVSTYGKKEEVIAALHPDIDADYLGSPAIFPTSTKPNAPSCGLNSLTELRQHIKQELNKQHRADRQVPVIAIGGINLSNAQQCIDAGAEGLAVIRGILGLQDNHEIKKHTQLLRALLRKAD